MARPSKADRAFTRAVLGAPVVPPGAVTRGVLRVRRGLGRVQREAVPGSLRILDGLFGLFDNRVLGLLCELDIPEHLGAPRTADELAAATGAPMESLERLLRFSVARGFLGLDRKGRYRANAVTVMLRRDQPGSWRGWVEFASSDWFWSAWRRADAPFSSPPESGMVAATGTGFFEHLEDDPSGAGAAFHAAMEAGATMQAVALSHGLDWDGIRRVCDVGGGTGAALRTLTRLRPELEPLLFDRPEVVAAAPPDLPSVGGDFFAAVPTGCDRYLLLAIVHDWGDADARAPAPLRARRPSSARLGDRGGERPPRSPARRVRRRQRPPHARARPRSRAHPRAVRRAVRRGGTDARSPCGAADRLQRVRAGPGRLTRVLVGQRGGGAEVLGEHARRCRAH